MPNNFTVATETLHYENARFAQQLFNHEPRNLTLLETELGVKATAREGWIKLDGTAENIARAKHFFSSLENLLKAGSPVKNREFTHALQVVKHEGATMLKDMVSDRITTHERKPGVTAKTVGQKNIWRRSASMTSRSVSDRQARAKRIWRWRWRCRRFAKARCRESF